MKQLHDSRPNINHYDMRLKHNVLCETSIYQLGGYGLSDTFVKERSRG